MAKTVKIVHLADADGSKNSETKKTRYDGGNNQERSHVSRDSKNGRYLVSEIAEKRVKNWK